MAFDSVISRSRNKGYLQWWEHEKTRKTCPKELWNKAQKKMTFLNTAQELSDLRALPGNQLESLSGDRDDHYSIRINDQYRVCFRWTEQGTADVEIVDYHD